MPQQQPSSKKRKRPVSRAISAAILAAASAAAAFAGAAQPAEAIVRPTPPPPPRGAATSEPTPTPNSAVLPLNSSLFFVLDQSVGSHSPAGTVVRAHLRDPIVLRNVTVAPAGTPVELEVTQSSAAKSGGINGSFDVYFRDLQLPGGKTLALVTPTGHVNPHISAGAASTGNITDTVGDIFIPGHFLYHMLRKGEDVTLRPGTIIRARTAETLSFAHGKLAVIKPAPFVTNLDEPHASFSAAPVATPPGWDDIPSRPKPTRTPAPSPTPSP